MEDDAIQPDVSIEQPQQPVLSEREQAMLAIQQEIAGRYPQPEETPAEPQEEEEKPAPVATPQTVRVKVDGEERELPIEEVVKGYQKDSVASKRLEEAAKLRRDIEAREAALAERERQIQAQVVAPSPVDEEDLDLTAAFEAFEAGDSAGAAAIIAEAIKKGRQPATPAVNTDEVIAKAAQQAKAEVAAEQEERERQREFQAFVAENPLFKEPEEGELYTPQRARGDYLFANLYGKQYQDGEISYREALQKTAEHVLREFAPPAPAPDPREERKKHIDNIPTASGARAAQSVKERTVEDVLEEMRKARGQAA